MKIWICAIGIILMVIFGFYQLESAMEARDARWQEECHALCSEINTEVFSCYGRTVTCAGNGIVRTIHY